MAAKFLYSCKAKALNAQIRAAEQQLARQQQRVTASRSCLLQHLQQRMTAPATLWQAAGIGFLFGELTKPQTRQTCNQNKPSFAPETTVLSHALNFITLIHDLYLALPLILVIKSYVESNVLSGTSNYRKVSAAQKVAVDHTDSSEH
jgi:hypothetical protein